MSHHSDEPIDEAAGFHRGLHLFNTGEWFEAHEAWEDIWRPASGERKAFYQGLIQAAVVVEHIRRGNPRGMRSVHETCLTKFAGLPEIYMGVPVKRLLADLATFIAPVLALPPERFTPEAGKNQPMPVDWSKVPRIELAFDPFSSTH